MAINVAYGTEGAITITLASLATSSTRLTGRASTAVSNATTLALDYILSGFVTTGTSPSANGIFDLWLYAQTNDTPTYPLSITGTDAALTINTTTLRDNCLRHVQSITIEASPSSNVTYYFPPVSVAQIFGFVPKRWGIYVAHSTGVNLNSTASNHEFVALPITGTSA